MGRRLRFKEYHIKLCSSICHRCLKRHVPKSIIINMTLTDPITFKFDGRQIPLTRKNIARLGIPYKKSFKEYVTDYNDRYTYQRVYAPEIDHYLNALQSILLQFTPALPKDVIQHSILKFLKE